MPQNGTAGKRIVAGGGCVCVCVCVACRRMTSTLLMQHLLLDETQHTKSSNRSKITVTHSRDWLIAFVMSRIINKYNTTTNNNNNEHLYNNTALYHLNFLAKRPKTTYHMLFSLHKIIKKFYIYLYIQIYYWI